MVNKILFITEGKKPDRNLVKSVCTFQNTIKSDSIVDYEIIPYSTNIHSLYQQLTKNSFEQTVELIKEKEGEKNFPYSSDDFSLIYLFFDLDMHHHSPETDLNKIKDNLLQMLDTFDDETGNGKLFLSYPMVEANQYFHENFITDTNISLYKFPIFNQVHFKKICADFIRRNGAIQSRIAERLLVWKYLIYYTGHVLKYLGIDLYPTDTSIDSTEIFNKQFHKFINRTIPEVVLLSAFPQYLLHVYGIEKLLEENQIKTLTNEGLQVDIVSVST